MTKELFDYYIQNYNEEVAFEMEMLMTINNTAFEYAIDYLEECFNLPAVSGSVV